MSSTDDNAVGSDTVNPYILIRGAGNLGSGVAFSLYKHDLCNRDLSQTCFSLVMTELAAPTLIHTTVCYGTCLLNYPVVIAGLTAQRSTHDTVQAVIQQGRVPVVIDRGAETIKALRPQVVIDTVSNISNDTLIEGVPLIIGIGPGFRTNENCHIAIETNRQQNSTSHLIYAPTAGLIRAIRMIGERVKQGTVIATIDEVPVTAPIDGVIRGILDEFEVTVGYRIAEIDPQISRKQCFTFSERVLAVGDRVVQAIIESFDR